MKDLKISNAASVSRANGRHRRWRRVFMGLAAAVTFITAYMLILPAITMEYHCGLEEHTHTDACYERRLICGQEEGALTGEEAAHEHDSDCYTQQKTRTCGLEESEGHTHTDACYGNVCGETEGETHTHTDACIGLICGQEESEGHTHTDACDTTEETLTCGQTADGHVHTDACYETVLVCGLPEHTHTAACQSVPEAEQTQEAFPEEVPAGYVAYTYQDAESGLSVLAYAPENAFGGAAVTLKAALLDDGSDGYAQAQADLDAAEDFTYDGFVALDVRFENDAGAEAEPDPALGQVFVKIQAEALLPADVDESTLAVQHHTEEESSILGFLPAGSEIVVQTVADSAERTGEVAAKPSESNEAALDVETAFEVQSFSTFTITWKGGNGLAAYCIDSTGTGIGTASTGNITAATAVTVIRPSIAGYVFSKAVIASSSSTAVSNAPTIARLRRSSSRWQYSIYSSGDNWSSIGSAYKVYFIYEQVIEVRVSDTSLISEGNLTAQLTDALSIEVPVGATLTYAWEKRPEGAAEWSPVTRTAVTQVNGENLYNVAEDGAWLNVALDDGARASYRVSLTAVNGAALEKAKVSPVYTVTYYNALQNGGFETPAGTSYGLSGTYEPHVPSGEDGIIWKTTASTGKIELVSVATSEYLSLAQRWHGLSTVPDGGDQCAELNENAAGALYQDVLTVPGSTMYWSLMHNARSRNNGPVTGYDTMYVIIAPVEKVQNVITQADLEEVRSDPETYGATVRKLTTHTSWGWKNYTGEYTVPGGQCLTRYFFMSGATASSDNTIGNHIDRVYFDTTVPPAAPGTASLEITKHVTGDLSQSELNALKASLQFEVACGSEQRVVTGSQMNWDGYTGTYAVQGVSVPANGAVSYTVREDVSNADVYGYRRTSTAGSGSEDLTVTGTLDDGDTGTVVYTNRYDRESVDLTLQKTFEGLTQAEVDSLRDLRFTVTPTAGDSLTVSFASTGAEAWTPVADTPFTYRHTLSLPAGEYTVAESGMELRGYHCAVSVRIGDGEPQQAAQAQVSTGAGGTAVSFVNRYEYTALSLTKQVARTDGGTNTSGEFTFRLALPADAAGTYAVTYAGEETMTHTDGSVTFTASGETAEAELKLYHNETATLYALPVGTQVVMTETSTDGYAVKWEGDLSGQTAQGPTITANAISGTPVRITCINTTGAVLPHTGGPGVGLILILGAMLTFGAGAILLLRNRREGSGTERA